VALGGFVYSARTGTSLTIEPGTPIDECLEAMAGHLDADTIAALARSSALAKSRRIAKAYPLIAEHRERADEILAMLDPDDEFNIDNPDVAKALLDRTERALAEYFRLSDAG
jgi:hypothetical protein